MSNRTADRRPARSPEWHRGRRAEAQFARQLRKVARYIGDLVGAFPAGDIEALPAMQAALRRYSEALRPWAQAVASRMVEDVAHRDAQEWAAHARLMGRALRRELRETPIGEAVRELLGQQVELITSLPLEAGQRVHRLTMEALETGARAGELAREIARTGEVTLSRAMLIARTETSRTATTLTKVRAESVGSTMFIWRTAEDSDVRPTHRRLNGRAFRWDAPPECDPGHHALPGCIWNCRCYAEPIIPEEDA